jgi:hypothetical protein
MREGHPKISALRETDRGFANLQNRPGLIGDLSGVTVNAFGE